MRPRLSRSDGQDLTGWGQQSEGIKQAVRAISRRAHTAISSSGRELGFCSLNFRFACAPQIHHGMTWML